MQDSNSAFVFIPSVCQRKVTSSLLLKMATCAPRLSLYVLGTVVMIGLVARCDLFQSHFGAYLPGDIVLGILQSVHSKVKDLQYRVRPEMYTCTE